MGAGVHRVAAVGAVVVVVILAQSAWMGRAVIGLNVGLLIAFAVWARRGSIDPSWRGRVLGLFAIGIAVQVLHCAEEGATGFAAEFPGLFGYAWSTGRFVAFNAVWLAVFAAAAVGVRRGWDAAALPVWFFALVGGVGNGVLHIAASVARAGYFPGLLTAPVLLVVGVLLLRRLLDATWRVS
jgi:Protein of unknown function with HXXEE motif